jgi:hypothetical protein
MAANHGASDCQPNLIVALDTHDLDIFAPGWRLAAAISSVDLLFNRQNQPLKSAQRSMTDADRGVIAKRNIATSTARK